MKIPTIARVIVGTVAPMTDLEEAEWCLMCGHRMHPQAGCRHRFVDGAVFTAHANCCPVAHVGSEAWWRRLVARMRARSREDA